MNKARSNFSKLKLITTLTALAMVVQLPTNVALAGSGWGDTTNSSNAPIKVQTYYANSPVGPVPQLDPITGLPTINPSTNLPTMVDTGTALRKFVDALPGIPGITSFGANGLGQYIPLAVPEKNWVNPATGITTADDYYEIAAVEFSEKMHSDLPKATHLRGYVQLETAGNAATSKHIALTYPDTTPVLDANKAQVYAYDTPHHLGPIIQANSGTAVRIKFTNYLPVGAGGNLFLPVDKTIIGANLGPGGTYTQNRAEMHLVGGNTPWISAGSPHQWVAPAGEAAAYTAGLGKGASTQNVPDMLDPGNGSVTLYYPNSLSARFMFYQDRTSGLTRINSYAGLEAGYLVSDVVERQLSNTLLKTDTPIPALTAYAGVLPADQIPLIIEDKTFVPANIAQQDAKWDTIHWGQVGDLWFSHVYETNQDPNSFDGINPVGRWDYGPWFWPIFATTAPLPSGIYGDASITPEAMMDTPVINGTAYPTLTVDPKAYRFRILNASNDRYINLGLYKADATPNIAPQLNKNGNPIVDAAGNHLYFTGTEVKLVPAVADVNGNPLVPNTPLGTGLPYDPLCLCQYPTLPQLQTIAFSGPTRAWPTDSRVGGVPDPSSVGPDIIAIGNDGGFLPNPVDIPSQPVTYEQNRRSITVSQIYGYGLLLGPAERQDAIIDFSQYAGQTLILYNDAPAPAPFGDVRDDYFTGDPDLTSSGGTYSTKPGYGPNTRTMMQIKVNAVVTGTSAPAAPYNATALLTALPAAYAASQPAPIVPETAYNNAFGTSDYDTYTHIATGTIAQPNLEFTTSNKNGTLTLTGVNLVSSGGAGTGSGTGYRSAPKVVFNSGTCWPGPGPDPAQAFATIDTLPNPTGTHQVTAVTLGVPGQKTVPTYAGYKCAPAITFDATSASGAVVDIQVASAGTGYTNPTVTVSAPTGTGTKTTATATAAVGTSAASVTMTNGGSGYTPSTVGVSVSGGSVSGVTGTATVGTSAAATSVTAGGSGYTSATVNIINNGGVSGLTGTATLGNSPVNGITVTNAGSGYTVPTVSFSGGAGSGASATATASTSGVSSIAVTAGGSGYSAITLPTVSFAVANNPNGVVPTPPVVSGVTVADVPTGALLAINVTNGGGTGYDPLVSPITVTIDPPQQVGGVQATATVTSVVAGAVQTVTITNPGSGYTLAPNVTITDTVNNVPLIPNGPGSALAGATLNYTLGVVTGVTLSSPGSGYSVPPTLTVTDPLGLGTGATATASLVDPAAGAVSIGNLQGGTGYTSAPTVSIKDCTGCVGTLATATATVSNAVGAVAGVTLTDPATGKSPTTFTSTPTFTISGNGTGATATASLTDPTAGTVTGVALNPNAGFTSAPTVTITDTGTGKNAQATATVAPTAGTITGMTLTAAGTGYVLPPTVTISDPTGTGAKAAAYITGISGLGAQATALMSNSQSIPIQSKTEQELFDPSGRDNATGGLENGFVNAATQTTVPMAYIDPPTEILADGETQIWKIVDNGLWDNNVHFSFVDVQLINRTGWDGTVKSPAANEVGWKDNIRVNPLENIAFAMRAKRPSVPFGLPKSSRPQDPSNPPFGTAVYDNEYVWSSTVLGHSEDDFMRPIVFNPTVTLPSAPTGLNQTISNGVLTLHWTDPTPGTPASASTTLANAQNEIGFTIQRAAYTLAANGATYTLGAYAQVATAPANATSFTDTTAVAGNDYAYIVSAWNAAGSTASVAGLPTLVAPGVPSGVAAAVNATTGAVTVTWAAPVGGAPGYLVSITNSANVAIAGSPFTVVGATTYSPVLPVGVSYKISVAAQRGMALASAYTAAVVADLTTPAVPVLTSSIASPSGAVTLNWTATTNAGLVPASSYLVTITPTTGAAVVGSPFTVTNATTFTTNPAVVTLNRTYTITVKSRLFGSATTTSVASNAVTANLTAPAALKAPVGLKATVAPATGVVTLNWTASAGASGYLVAITTGAPAAPVAGSPFLVVGGATTTFTPTLAPGTYNVTLAAQATTVNGMTSTSPYSTPAVVATVPNGAVLPPTGLGVQSFNASTGVPTLSWTASTTTAVTGYLVSINGAAGVNTVVTAGVPATSYTPATVPSLTSAYSFTVTTQTAAGNSLPSAPFSVTWTAPTAPAVPAPTVVANPGGTATVSWASVTGATGYQVVVDALAPVLVSAPTLTYTTAVLSTGVAHTFQVRAVTTSYPGAVTPAVPLTATSAYVATVPASVTVPAAPVVSVPSVNASTGAVTLSWPNVTGATGYQVAITTGAPAAPIPGSPFTVTAAVGANTTYIPTLALGSSYSITVAATSATATSAYSLAAVTANLSAPTAPATPAVPSTLTNADGSVTLTWTAVANATGYQVFVDSTLVTTTSALTYTSAILTTGVVHTFQIAALTTYFPGATSPVGGLTSAASALSPSASVTVPAPVLLAVPTGLVANVTTSTGAVTLNWTASSGATGYLVSIANGVTAITGSPFTVTGASTYSTTLPIGGTYNVSVAAVAGVTTTAYSPLVQVSLPAAPTVTLPTVNASTGAVPLNWTTVANATGYLVSIDGALPGILVTAPVTMPYTPSVSALPFGSVHSISVAAQFAGGGTTPYSTPVTADLSTPAPATPSLPGPVVANIGTATWTWTPVTGATGYNVYVDGVLTTTTTATTYTSAVLSTDPLGQNVVVHNFSLEAYITYFPGAAKPVTVISTPPARSPAQVTPPVTGLIATVNANSGAVTLGWTGSALFAGYQVTITPVGSVTPVATLTVPGGTATSSVVVTPALALGSKYNVSVVAKQATITANAVSLIAPIDLSAPAAPAAPVLGVPTANPSGTVTVTWPSVANATGYQVVVDTLPAVAVAASNSPTFTTAAPLSTGVAHTIKVTAYTTLFSGASGGGISTSSTTATATVTLKAPLTLSPPTTVTAKALPIKGSVSISWVNPTANANNVNNYTVQYQKATSAPGAVTTTWPAGWTNAPVTVTTTYVQTGLTTGASYRYQVIANGTGVSSLASAISNTVVAK